MTQRCPAMTQRCPAMTQRCPAMTQRCPAMTQRCPGQGGPVFPSVIYGLLQPIHTKINILF